MKYIVSSRSAVPPSGGFGQVDQSRHSDAAKSKALANPGLGKGGLQQKLIPNANDLIKNGDLVLVDIIELK